MASAFLVIGIGGLGRGICNHLKYELEQEYGSTDNAKTKLLVIDGPEKDDVYLLPGDFQIDTGKGSREFYRTELSPADIIKSIANRKVGQIPTDPTECYISQWLSPEAARDIPTSAMSPGDGFGGHRAPGHAFFYCDINNIQKKLQYSYNSAKTLLSGGAQLSGQLIIIVAGSLSGGTGAGLLFDFLHLLRSMADKDNDMLITFIPMPNTYHSLMKSAGQKKELNAQNFAGLINLMRFMGAKNDYPTIIPYSDSIIVKNSTLVNIPCLVDGDVNDARFNDVYPRFGVAPVTANFILTLIKDNLHTSAIQSSATNWSQKHIGVADDEEKYAAFGCSSVCYPYQEILKSFAYRFTVALYDEILNPQSTDLGKGESLAISILTSTTFTQMVADSSVIPHEPPIQPQYNPAFKSLGNKIKTGKLTDATFSYPSRDFINQIPHSGRVFGKEPIQVKKDTEKLTQRLRQEVEGWLSRQRNYIVNQYVTNVEGEIENIFYDKSQAQRPARTLQTLPCSLVIARDLIKCLNDKLTVFKDYSNTNYEKSLFTSGSKEINIISAHLTRLSEVEKKMGKSRDSQEAYLLEAQRHMDLEIWSLLMQGVVDITSDMIDRTNKLWNLIGDSADGWVNLLNRYRNFMNDKYLKDLHRRKGFDEFRLRRYAPITGGLAEDQLFGEVAEPVLVMLKSQMSWSFAMDAQNQDKYSLILHTPSVSGYDETKALSDLRDVITGERLRGVSNYNPLRHYYYAFENLKGPLSAKTLWDILEMECKYDWINNLNITPDKRTEEEFFKDLTEEFVKQSEIALNYRIGENHYSEEFTFGSFPGDSKSFGGKILNLLRAKNLKIISNEAFSKELRRIQVALRVPIRQWATYSEAQADYIAYTDAAKQKILIDIYPHEQNAVILRKLIENKVDRSFAGTIDFAIVSALYNLDTFKYFAFAYLLDLIPKKEGNSKEDPKIFYLDFSNGVVELAEEWNINSLLHNINDPLKKIKDDEWRSNEDVQKRIEAIWKNYENSQKTSSEIKNLLTTMETKANNLNYPAPPANTAKKDALGETGRKHLKLAIQALVKNYIEAVEKNLNS